MIPDFSLINFSATHGKHFILNTYEGRSKHMMLKASNDTSKIFNVII